MKTIIRLAIFALIAVVAYNYFVGNENDREPSERVVEEGKDLGKAIGDFGKAIGDLIKSTKENYDEGEYDDVLDRLGEIIDNVKERAKEIDLDIFRETKDIEQSKEKLEDALKDGKNEDGVLSDENKEKALKELRNLQEKLEQLGREIESRE